MANEIKVSLVLTVANGAFKHSINPGSLNITQASIGLYGGVQSIGTSNEVVVFGDVTNAGVCYLQNLDTTNWVEYGPATDNTMVSFGKLKPGEIAMARIKPGVVMRAQANGAAVRLRVDLLED